MSKQNFNQQKTAALRRAGTLNPHEQAVTDALFQHSDFFDPRDLVQVKYEMLRRVRVERASISRTVGDFGFSRPSFYQAQAAFAARGLGGLLPQKPGPRGAHKLTAEVIEFLEEELARQPTLTGDELAALLRKRRQLVVHPRSIERGLQRHRKRRG
jgi:transposase